MALAEPPRTDERPQMVRVGRPPRDRPAKGFTLAATLARVGLHKPLVMAAMKSALPPSMPHAARSVLIRDLTSPRNQRAAAREAQEIGDLGSTLTDLQSRGLPDVPVTTIVGALTDRPKLAALRATMPPCRAGLQRGKEGVGQSDPFECTATVSKNSIPRGRIG